MRKKILVVDDDQGILDAFEVLLDSAGYDVSLLSDAEQLMKLPVTKFPNLIILDVLLSGVDGREICKQLKSQEKTKRIPIIMVSAHPNAEKSVIDACADGFLAKPFEMEDLLTVVAKHIT